MRKKFLMLCVITTMFSTILIGCNDEKQPTNEVINTNTETSTISPTPTEYIDYNNPLEVGGVGNMGVSNEEIEIKNDKYANDFMGIMDVTFEPKNGLTCSNRAYVYRANEFNSFMETTVEFSDGNSCMFSWLGETNMGSDSKIDESGKSIVLYDKDKKTMLAVWNCRPLNNNEFEIYKNANLKSQISQLDTSANVNENWEEIIDDNKIAFFYTINLSDGDIKYKGFKKTILDKTNNKYVQFYIVQTIDDYDEINLYKTISTIELINENDVLYDKMTTTVEIKNDTELVTPTPTNPSKDNMDETIGISEPTTNIEDETIGISESIDNIEE